MIATVRSIFAVTTLLLTILPCRANLGETLEECVARYGKPIGSQTDLGNFPGEKMIIFQKSGFYISIIMLHGVAGLESFWKVDDSTMTDSEIALFLNKEASSNQWKQDARPDEDKLFARSDGANAIYQTEKKIMEIISSDYLVAEADKNTDSKSKLQGF